jgi:hypothetical protein
MILPAISTTRSTGIVIYQSIDLLWLFKEVATSGRETELPQNLPEEYTVWLEELGENYHWRSTSFSTFH